MSISKEKLASTKGYHNELHDSNGLRWALNVKQFELSQKYPDFTLSIKHNQDPVLSYKGGPSNSKCTYSTTVREWRANEPELLKNKRIYLETFVKLLDDEDEDKKLYELGFFDSMSLRLMDIPTKKKKKKGSSKDTKATSEKSNSSQSKVQSSKKDDKSQSSVKATTIPQEVTTESSVIDLTSGEQPSSKGTPKQPVTTEDTNTTQKKSTADDQNYKFSIEGLDYHFVLKTNDSFKQHVQEYESIGQGNSVLALNDHQISKSSTPKKVHASKTKTNIIKVFPKLYISVKTLPVAPDFKTSGVSDPIYLRVHPLITIERLRRSYLKSNKLDPKVYDVILYAIVGKPERLPDNAIARDVLKAGDEIHAEILTR